MGDGVCSLCGAHKSSFIIKEDVWTVRQCRECSFVYVTPLPDEQFLYRHYQQYLPAKQHEIEQWRRMMEVVFQTSLDRIARYGFRQGTLLDIGCGHGFFLEKARKRGWSVYGIEPCAHAQKYAAEKNMTVDSCALFERAYQDEMFDVVTLFYVLEHLPQPIRYLKEIHRILKPGGIVLVRVPHTTPLVKFLKIFGIPNRLYDAPSHLGDFSPQTIAFALTKSGFDGIVTFPGGWTLPSSLSRKIISAGCGVFAEGLYRLSGKRFLLPGISKTTIAKKTKSIHD